MSIPLGPINPDDPALEVYRSLPPRPKFWELWLAKLLGTKKVTTDKGVKVTSYFWRGKMYVSQVEYLGSV